nr:immunoglobulin light chain junction region [Macaca mulatta]MOX70922.1 immunoglobulin light chain junction region [Macaca mulatta]MOX71128.1 immunoglobulin light chain junction region [Macaca mulatta]MOX71410.1 immunoglobulin light chain junction region [Macaca mulatta]MOX76422.1 immunoglobulin light chain junction region [Macaca mulatta]
DYYCAVGHSSGLVLI